MKRLDLSENPLSSEGACALFRLILAGLSCFVLMRDCTLSFENNLFNGTFPSDDSPYLLDLSKPYDAAVLSELVYIALARPSCQFQSISYSASSRNCQLYLNYNSRCLSEKGREDEWVQPDSGMVDIVFYQKMMMPSMDLVCSANSLNVLKLIIIHARSPFDRKKWLKLLCSNIYCTTAQAQNIIDDFQEKRTVFGIGGISKLDVVAG